MIDPAALVIITRPKVDAEPFAAELAERGIASVVEPMIDIEPMTGADVDLAGCQAILFTSANGVRAFTGLTERRDVTVIAVGPASGDAARLAGFSDVHVSGGNVERLARTVVMTLRPDDGILFHAAGSVTAGDLQGLLGAEGFEVRRRPLYRSVMADRFTPQGRTALSKGTVTAATFFSPRTASAFARVIRSEGLEVCTKDIWALCLSDAVADAATESGLEWRGTRIAAATEQSAMADLVLSVSVRNEGSA